THERAGQGRRLLRAARPAARQRDRRRARARLAVELRGQLRAHVSGPARGARRPGVSASRADHVADRAMDGAVAKYATICIFDRRYGFAPLPLPLLLPPPWLRREGSMSRYFQ